MRLLTILLLVSLNAIAQEEVQQSPVKPEVTLEQAYKREYLFLAAQKRELEERVKKYKNDSSKLISKNEKEVDELEKKYLKVTRLSEKTREDLAQSERSLEAISSERDSLNNVIAQSASTLSNYIEFKDIGEQDISQKLDMRFNHAIELLSNAQKIIVKKGHFYALNGDKVEGSIVEMGRIASFGLSETENGTLAPAGLGQYKVWEKLAKNEIEAITNGGNGNSTSVFLHESSLKDVTKKEGKTLSDIMKAGGTIGWVIVALGFITFAMVLGRGLLIFRARKGSDEVTHKAINFLREGKREEAIKYTENETGAIAKIVQTILKAPENNKEVMENMTSEQMVRQWSVIDRFGTLILVSASVAPLLGLLGTVTGMIATFDIITEFGTGDPKMLSSGISEALVTTMFGLIVAIPALMLGSVLSSESDKIKSRMEEAALSVMNELNVKI